MHRETRVFESETRGSQTRESRREDATNAGFDTRVSLSKTRVSLCTLSFHILLSLGFSLFLSLTLSLSSSLSLSNIYILLYFMVRARVPWISDFSAFPVF